MMKRLVAVVFCVVLSALAFSDTRTTANDSTKADAPADRVVVMYFHRTQRCPTCQRMGSYTEEAVTKGFPKEMKDGEVEFHYVDFQDAKNAALAKGYNVAGPTLIVAHIVGNKVKEFNNLDQIWAKNRDKAEFLKYVRENVKKWLVASKTVTPSSLTTSH